jgi:iron(III) transport system substrate-binding protein
MAITLVAGVALSLVACGTSGTPTASSTADSKALTALVAAAKAEGSLSVYTGQPLAQAEYMVKKFEARYGITTTMLSLPTGTLFQRFATESTAGSFNADVIVAGEFETAAAATYLPNGWMTPVSDLKIPAITDGAYPKAMLNKVTVTVGNNPWIIGYNTKLVGSTVPTTWEDMAKPEFKGKLCIPNPGVAPSYIEVWVKVLEATNATTLKAIAANQPKIFPSAGAAAAALGAGECAISAPQSGAGMAAVAAAGAPVKSFIPKVDSGTIMAAGIINVKKSAHPNAASLFMQWLLSPEGNEAQAHVGDGLWVLNPQMKAAEFAAFNPPVGAASRKAEILGLLGVNP